MRLLLSIVLLLAATLAVGCSAQETGVSGGDTQEPQEVQLRILAINDFHGNIATTSDAFGGVGRADYLAANIAAARAGTENSVFVSAGDLIGGSAPDFCILPRRTNHPCHEPHGTRLEWRRQPRIR